MQEDLYKSGIKVIVGVVVVSVGLRYMINKGFFEPKSYKGNGFKVKIPADWKRDPKLSTNKISEDKKTKVGTVTFVSPEIIPNTELHEGMISATSYQSPAPIWMEDIFPTILQQVVMAGYKIIDQGDMNVHDSVAKWILMIDQEKTIMNLEFYLVGESGILYKLAYIAQPKYFKKHAPIFDALRQSFRFSVSVF